MNKIILSVTVCCVSVLGFSQSKNVQNAYNSHRQEKFVEAKEYIDIAFNHEQTANDPKMWNYRAQIYLEIMQKHSELDVNAAFKATEAHIKCLQRDSKGRIIVRKWTREEDVINGLVQCGYNLYNTAIEDYQNSNYQSSIKKYKEIFKIIELDKENLLKRGNIVPSTIYHNIYLSAIKLNDVDMQIEYLQKSIDLNVSANVYKYMSNIYIAKGDLEKALDYIQQGKEMFDDDILLINSEIDLYLKMKKSNSEIIEILTDAIELDDLNEILFIIRAQRYIEEKMYDLAEKDLLTALDLEPSSKTANNNLASLYLSKTEPLVNELNELSYSDKSKRDVLNLKIDELKIHSLPYLIAYTESEPTDKAALNTLAKIYYQLGMEKESTETRNKLNSLD